MAQLLPEAVENPLPSSSSVFSRILPAGSFQLHAGGVLALGSSWRAVKTLASKIFSCSAGSSSDASSTSTRCARRREPHSSSHCGESRGWQRRDEMMV